MTEPEPIDPNALPLAHLGRELDPEEQDGDPGQRRPSHLRVIVIVAVAVVVVGFVVGILVFNSSAPSVGRGASTARQAAQRYVDALNTGEESAAGQVACDSFTDDARAEAASGKDPGITFVLGAVRPRSKTEAAAVVTERFKLPGGSVRNQPANVRVLKEKGRWLVCGQL